MLKVICIDDKNRPNEFPTSRWIKNGQEYTIIEVVQMAQQPGEYGCKLAEIKTDDLFPYTHFNIKRFTPLSQKSPEEILNEIETEVFA
jgi:hypothetical protein